MKGDETPDAYLNRAQEDVALDEIGKLVNEKDLVMLVVSSLRDKYNTLKSIITAGQNPSSFTELRAFLSDHDFMVAKSRKHVVQAFHNT